MGAAVLYQLAPEHSVVTLNLSVNFLDAVRIGDLLVGRAVIDGYSKSHIFVSGTLSGPGGIVATAVGTFAKIRSKDGVPNFRKLVNKLMQNN